MEPGQTLGHESMGVVEEAGTEVHEVKVSDRVVIPFNIDCGHCCIAGSELWSQCDKSNPKGRNQEGAFGYTETLGGYNGGQSEYVSVTICNTVVASKVPDSIKTDQQVLFLSDILPTEYFGADIANVQPGNYIAVFGARPWGF